MCKHDTFNINETVVLVIDTSICRECGYIEQFENDQRWPAWYRGHNVSAEVGRYAVFEYVQPKKCVECGAAHRYGFDPCESYGMELGFVVEMPLPIDVEVGLTE